MYNFQTGKVSDFDESFYRLRNIARLRIVLVVQLLCRCSLMLFAPPVSRTAPNPFGGITITFTDYGMDPVKPLAKKILMHLTWTTCRNKIFCKDRLRIVIISRNKQSNQKGHRYVLWLLRFRLRRKNIWSWLEWFPVMFKGHQAIRKPSIGSFSDPDGKDEELELKAQLLMDDSVQFPYSKKQLPAMYVKTPAL